MGYGLWAGMTIVMATAAIAAIDGCSGGRQPPPEPVTEAKVSITSSAFAEGKSIPDKFSAYGDNVSPPLAWSDIPKKAKSLALIVDDPDAPRPEPFVHWVLFDIPASEKGLDEGASKGVSGNNDTGKSGYFGPRPPSGVHHYRFKLYALDATLGLKEGATKADVLKAMEGHVLAKGELVGTYEKK